MKPRMVRRFNTTLINLLMSLRGLVASKLEIMPQSATRPLTRSESSAAIS